MSIPEKKNKKHEEMLANNDANQDNNSIKNDDLFSYEEYKKALNKVRHRSIELFSERQILRKALKQINFQKLEIEKQKDEIQKKNEKLNKALAKARKRTIDLFGKHIDLKKAKKYISIINEDVEKKNILLQKSYNELEIKNTQINDSIDYAKHIQRAILPPDEQIKTCFPDSFVFFNPKEVVSGDFYWLAEKKNIVYLAVIDCTGHGVPGAFMSMIGNTLLNKIVNSNENISVSNLLERLNTELFDAFYRDKKDSDFQNDGMDITVCRYDKIKKEVSISSAGHNFVIINNGILKMYKGNLLGIGEIIELDYVIEYEVQKIEINKPVQIYMFSDGFADQFGGEKDKKFHNNKLKTLIQNNYTLPMEKQKAIFSKVFHDWKGKSSQTDDVLLIGINFNPI